MSGDGRRIVLTGAAGFIGFHLARRLLADGAVVLGLDDLNAHYDPALKEARLALLAGETRFRFERRGLGDHAGLADLVGRFRPTEIVHLAARAGVRRSLEEPRDYVAANIDGFLAILEACRRHPVRHLVYASSSSVYGGRGSGPSAETDAVDHPVSLYAATKRSNELMADSYAHLFGIPATGLRFFTVYGPWGRPDMAYWTFTDAIASGRPIELFNHGRMSRDLTYVEDAVEAVVRLLGRVPDGVPPHTLVNVGSHAPVALDALVAAIETALGRKAERLYGPMSAADVPATFADVSRLRALTGYVPSTPVEEGIAAFVRWFTDYRQLG